MGAFDNIWLSDGYCPICDQETRVVSAKHESYGHCIECGHRISLRPAVDQKPNEFYIPPDTKFYEPETWKCHLMGQWPYPRQVEFSAEEVQMLREMSHKTGYPRDHIIREAVRQLYAYTVYKE